MTKHPTSIEVTTGSSVLKTITEIAGRIEQNDRDYRIAIAALMFGIIVVLLYSPLRQSEGGDSAGYDYIAQSILRGQMPYRDVVDIKTPGSAYLSALAMAAGKIVGLRDVIAVRLFQALLVGLLSVVTFLVARIYFQSSMVGLIAFVFPLMSHKFGEWMVVGTQPKLPMILFGMLSVLFIARDKPLLAGITSMLAFLCWQPGLMFTGSALVIFSRYFTSWRDWRAAKVLLGAALPLVVVFGYFYLRGALGDLWAWTITFNYSVFRPETHRAPVQALAHLWNVTRRIYGVDVVLVLMGIVGFIVFLVDRIRAKASRSRQQDLFKDAILIPPIVYFAFCIINMQAGPDLIPFIPFIGIFLGWFLVGLGRLISSRFPSRAKPSVTRRDLLIPGFALLAMIFIALGRGAFYRIPPGFTLQDQDAQFKALSDLLGPDDKIYVHGSVELLVLLQRPNLNPYTFLNQGIDRFASSRRAGDFNLILDELEAQRPKLVALSRLRTVSSRDLLERWVGENYDKLDSFTDSDVYVRKERKLGSHNKLVRRTAVAFSVDR